MNIRERKDYNRLRRRSAFLAIMVFCLLVWIKNLFDDKNWYLDENHALFQSNLKKDDQIRKMTKKIDSLQKVLIIPVTQQITPKQQRKKIITKDTTSIKDSIILVKRPESDSTEKTDSIK